MYGEYKLRVVWIEEWPNIRFQHRTRYPVVFVDTENAEDGDSKGCRSRCLPVLLTLHPELKITP
jgi:hypothetical protein